jgi:hypothetical protein
MYYQKLGKTEKETDPQGQAATACLMPAKSGAGGWCITLYGQLYWCRLSKGANVLVIK